MGKKFDIFKSLTIMLEQGEEEQQQQGVQQQPQQPMQQQQQQPQPQPQPNENGSENQPFRDLVGGTISNMAFKKVGSNGGQLTVTTSNSHVPTVISWVGTKVSLRLSNGDVVLLSE